MASSQPSHGQAIILAVQSGVLIGHVLGFDVAGFTEPFAERCLKDC